MTVLCFDMLSSRPHTICFWFGLVVVLHVVVLHEAIAVQHMDGVGWIRIHSGLMAEYSRDLGEWAGVEVRVLRG